MTRLFTSRQEVKATMGEILFWYDGPIHFEIFVNGAIGEAMAYATHAEANDKYVAYLPQPDIYARYRARMIDALTLMKDPGNKRFSFDSSNFNSDNTVTLTPMKALFTYEMLPDPGLYHKDL
jgi:hypothetical protein